ncbi:hypothetical protein [Rhizobium bangladeshense]|uniref:hypothetical protein n=1 Tax=Rhizobium bangladeshense TaxID=1138189 RepID=UPI0007E58053|nr:hypothetical protein [Rhizobium bangladeshense]
MIRSIIALSIASASLASCVKDQILVPKSVFISKTAAQHALPGVKAYQVALLSPTELKPGHIYNVRAGQFQEICGDDIAEQSKLKILQEQVVRDSTDRIEDTPRLDDVELEVLGHSIGPSYDSIKVNGYTTYKASTGTQYISAQYVLENVKRGTGSCYDDVLPRNRPYLVVDGTAVGKEVETWSKRGFGASGSIGGVIGGRIKPKDAKTATVTNAVFGASGTLVQ